MCQACFDTYRRHNKAHAAVCVYCRAAWGRADARTGSGADASGREGYINLAALQPGTDEGREWAGDVYGRRSHGRRDWYY